MSALRTVLVMARPLLTDIIKCVLDGRAALSVIPEIVDSQTATRYLRELGPAVVILGPAATARDLNAARVRFMLPHATVLALSADLTQLLGPGEDDVREFTLETLVDSIHR